MRVFMDIDVGDKAQHAQAQAAFSRFSQFFREVKGQYGLAGALEALRSEDKEMLAEALSSRTDEAFSTEEPPPLRAGRLVIELETTAAPKAAENFRCLCTGEKGLGKASKKPLNYKGVPFHRIVEGFVCQGGDIVKGDGSGGDSIYGGKFNDEKPGLKLKHASAGVVSMANSGKNSNTSQFFLTLAPAPQCDGKHVVVGRVVEGAEVLAAIGSRAASQSGEPRVPVTVADCGQLP